MLTALLGKLQHTQSIDLLHAHLPFPWFVWISVTEAAFHDLYWRQQSVKATCHDGLGRPPPACNCYATQLGVHGTEQQRLLDSVLTHDGRQGK